MRPCAERGEEAAGGSVGGTREAVLVLQRLADLSEAVDRMPTPAGGLRGVCLGPDPRRGRCDAQPWRILRCLGRLTLFCIGSAGAGVAGCPAFWLRQDPVG